ncbi:MAG: co-chaperone GroES [Planctomycetes bacterium]|nr:co-chaperone GroES [Planctomycetota bacterium]
MWPFSRSREKVRPLAGYVLIERLEEEERTQGGILLPETARGRSTSGDVLALGKGRPLDDGAFAEYTVRKGDRVLFSAHEGTALSIGDKEYLLLKEEDILAIVD